MIKLTNMTKNEVEQIAEAFADYEYQKGEKGLFYLFPNNESIKIYIRAFVYACMKNGWIYTTSEKREAYIAISYSENNPSLGSLWEVIRGSFKALGLKGCLNFIKVLKRGGNSLEDKLKKEKQKFIHIEMLAVTKQYQGQGYMGKAVDMAFKIAEEKNIPCILDTDGELKRDKYIHLGMEVENVRKIGSESYLYDLIKYPNRH